MTKTMSKAEDEVGKEEAQEPSAIEASKSTPVVMSPISLLDVFQGISSP